MFVYAIALLICGSPLEATNPQIAVGNAALPPSGGGFVYVNFVATDQAISGLQFDIRYQSQFFALAATAGDAASAAGKTVYTSNPQPDILRVLVVGFNQTTISSGVLVALSVQVNAGVALGGYSLSIENTAATGAGENAMGFSASDGSVTVTDSGPGPAVAAVANAASYAAGAIAPGEVLVIYGSSLGSATLTTKQLDASGLVSTALAGTRVLFEGTAAPLLYTSANQVSAIAPYGLDGHTQTSMQVEYQGIRSAPFVLPVIQASPGVFTADSSGRGQAAIVNQDGTVNTPDNPAPADSVVSIYGTGDGQTLPGGTDGFIVVNIADLRYTKLPVAASIGGQNADVIYTGSAGDDVCGIFQANVRIPKGLAGGSLPVILTVGNSNTQAGVTVAVR
jgi:uncharacterized protein (TIGR03437 family)